MDKSQLIEYILGIVKAKYGGRQVAFAQDKGLSAVYVSDVLKGRRSPGQKILDAVGIERVVSYVQKGEERS